MVSKKAAVFACIVTAAAAAGPAQAGAPQSASCIGQFFSEHAGLVPATNGEESVGGFIAPTAQEQRRDFGGAISGATKNPREDCQL